MICIEENVDRKEWKRSLSRTLSRKRESVGNLTLVERPSKKEILSWFEISEERKSAKTR